VIVLSGGEITSLRWLSWTTLTICSATLLSLFSPFSVFWIYYSQKQAVMIGKYCFRHTSSIDHKRNAADASTNLSHYMWTATALFFLPPATMYVFLLSLCCTFQQFFLDSSKFVASEMKYCQWIFLWGSLYAITSMCLPFLCQSWAHMGMQPLMTACVVQSPWQFVSLLGKWMTRIYTSWLELGMCI
jgi:hypothetical protein